MIYPSDLTDKEWQILQEIIPTRRVMGFKRKYSHKRWVVERIFAWLSRQRRLAKEYEFKIDHQKSMIYTSMSKLMLRRLV